MGRVLKQTAPDDGPSAPIWLLSFSDCMTNLVVFFVLLVTFSSFDKEVAGAFEGIRQAFSMGIGTVQLGSDKGAFQPAYQIWAREMLEQGSEKPTLATAETGREGTMRETAEAADFRSRRVFLIPSKQIFWWKGTAISFKGLGILATMGVFLKEVPCRLVISENGPGTGGDDEQLGLERAFAVMEYLTARQGLSKNRFSISAASTIAESVSEDGRSDPAHRMGGAWSEAERVIEIVLLERSIYN